jgi:hypothetical protein
VPRRFSRADLWRLGSLLRLEPLGSGRVDLAKIKLYDTANDEGLISRLIPNSLDLLQCAGVDPPVLAHLVEGDAPDERILVLNMGPYAHRRLTVNTTDGDEEFTVEAHPTAGVVVVRFGPFSQTFGLSGTQIVKVQAFGGDGNDVIRVVEDDRPFTIPVEFWGGAGNDLLVGGSGDD